MTAKPDNGIVTIRSHHSVDETVKRIEETLAAKDVKLFALIDHSGEAEKAGLQMRPTKLLIFGNPKAGTPWMVATPTKASPTSGTLPVIHCRRCRLAGGESR